MTAAGSYVVAERYARALLDVVLDQKRDPDRVAGELADFAELLDAHPRLADALSTPAVAAEHRVAVLNEVLSGQDLDPATANLLRLLTERERMPAIRLVVDQYRQLLLEHKQIQPGEVTAAHPLTAQQQERLAEGLGKALGKTMELSFANDPELVGGLVVRVGNRIFDASVVTQLQRFKEKALSTAL